MVEYQSPEKREMLKRAANEQALVAKLANLAVIVTAGIVFGTLLAVAIMGG